MVVLPQDNMNGGPEWSELSLLDKMLAVIVFGVPTAYIAFQIIATIH